MKIIAHQDNRRYLAVTDENEERPLGRVIDLDQGMMFPPFNVHSILARGYWEECEHSDALLNEILAEVEDMEPPTSED